MGNPDASENAVPRTARTTRGRAHALEAMAIAAGRARQGITPGAAPAATSASAETPPSPVPRRVSSWSEAASSPTDDLEGLLRSVPEPSVRETRPLAPRPETTVVHVARTRAERRLTVAVVVTAGFVVAAALALAVLAATGQQPSGHPPPPSTVPSTPHTHSPSTTVPSSSLPTPTPGAAPVVSSLSPTSGAAGQTITVLGANFMSPSGHIGAHVGTQLASIACPKQSTCTLTVPPPAVGAPSSVTVTVTTDSGTSNAADFTYR